jgi:catechol 2,3-dioxygenase
VPRDPEEVAVGGAPALAELPVHTRMGEVHLSVAHLGRSIDYYERVIGLRVHSREDSRAALGTGGEDLLVLEEVQGARPALHASGLYHFALLVPERADLARWLVHAARDRAPLVGLSDHFVSEAIYLSDPDAHGIEIYWDRPREVWEGQVARRLTTLPLDTDDLLRALDDPTTASFEGLPPRTVMGHVHLRVAAIPSTVSFYRDVLGFALMAALGTQAAFLSAGGYHHHFGANTWESAGAGQPPPGTATLTQATIVLPEPAARDAVVERVAAAGGPAADSIAALDNGDVLVRDPSGNPIALRGRAA